MLSPPKPLDEIQPNFVSELLICNSTIILAPPPGVLRSGKKGQISLNFNYKVNFMVFKPNFVNLLTNKRYITYQREFSFGRLGHAPRVDLGVLGVGGSKMYFFKSVTLGV